MQYFPILFLQIKNPCRHWICMDWFNKLLPIKNNLIRRIFIFLSGFASALCQGGWLFTLPKAPVCLLTNRCRDIISDIFYLDFLERKSTKNLRTVKSPVLLCSLSIFRATRSIAAQTVPPALTAHIAHNGLDHNVRSKPCIVQIAAEFHEHGIELLMKSAIIG